MPVGMGATLPRIANRYFPSNTQDNAIRKIVKRLVFGQLDQKSFRHFRGSKLKVSVFANVNALLLYSNYVQIMI